MLKKVLWGLTYSVLIGLVYFYVKSPESFRPPHQSVDVQNQNPATILSEKTLQTVPIGGPFKLTDQHGKIITDRDFLGKFLFVYFGYTYCPDVCPMALTNMDEALRMLKDQAKNIRVAFITVDPKRDTKEHLRDYMENYGPQFIGLTGSESAIRHAMKSYHIYAQKAQGSDEGQDYLIDHSSIVYVMNREGKFITSFNHQTSAPEILKIIKKYL